MLKPTIYLIFNFKFTQRFPVVLKRLASQTLLYGLGSILPRVLNFLLVPLHTINTFNKAEYGTVTKLFAFVAFLNVVYLFGMETAFFRFSTKPEADKKRIFNLAQSVVLTISLSLSLIFILFSSPIAQALGGGVKPTFIVWITLIMLIDAMVAIPFARLRLENKALLFAAAKIINVLILLGLNYYFLKINYDPAIGIGYVFLANLIANAFFILFFLKTLFAWRPAYDATISKSMFQYAYPVMLTGLAGMTNEMFSRLTLEWWLPVNFYPGQSNDDALGVFGACYKYAVFMNLGIQAFRYAAEPFFFSQASQKNSPQQFAQINHFFVITCCLFFIGVSIHLDVLQFLIGEEFREGLYIVPVLLMAYLFLGVYYNMSVWFKLTDKTYYGTWITAGGALITIAANYVLIPYLGYWGSSWAALLCYAGMTVACYVLGQRYYPIPYSIGKSGFYILFSIALVVVTGLITIENRVLSTLFHLAVCVLFVAVAYLLERKNLRLPAP